MMENFEIPENPEYTEQIRKFKTTDKAHADLFNATFQLLFNNEAFLKKMLEKQGIDIQEKFQQNYEQLTGYTDTKIGELINGAPETLDTIKEIADAILENETIVEALNEAVGKKLNKDGDLTDTTVTFITEDEEDSNRWKNIGKLVTGKMKDILNHVSIMSNNLKYLKKMLGSTDITKLADGTVTGAISKLNTDLQYKDISNEISTQNNYVSWCTAFIENGMVYIQGVIPKELVGAVDFLKINKKYAPRIATYGSVSFPASGSDINKVNCVVINTDGNIGAWTSALDYPVNFVFQYPLKRG